MTVGWLVHGNHDTVITFHEYCRDDVSDADESRCQQGKTLYGAGLRTEGENHLRLLAGSLPFHACRAACCRDSACHALWWLEGMCFQADCSKPQSCQPFRTDSSNSMLIIFQKSQTTDDLGLLPEDDEPHLLRLGWGRTSWRRQSLLGAPLTLSVPSSHHQSLLRDRQKRDLSVVPTHGAMQHSKVNHSEEAGALSPTSAEVRKTITVAGSFTSNHTTQTPEWPKNVSIHPEPSEHSSPVSGTPQVKSTEHSPTDAPLPVAPSYSYATPTPQASSQSTSAPHPVVKELVVSAGKSVQITLPKNEGHGEETGSQAKSRFLGFARILLADISEAAEKPVPALQFLLLQRSVDYPPVANAGPNQVITLPQNSITLFGNQSTDDHGITSYEWSLSPSSKGKVVEMQGVRTPALQLSAMQEGDYTYQLTVTDTAGQQATAQVTVIVQPENNKPPQADAGPDKELTLPVDSTTLDGSKSTDDQRVVSYLWEQSRGPDGVQLENANSSVATVTGLQVGTYVFTLTVKDERNLQSQSSVNVIVKEEINKPPVAKIAGNVVVTLPTSTAELDGSRSSDDKGIVSYLWTRDESRHKQAHSLSSAVRAMQLGPEHP